MQLFTLRGLVAAAVIISLSVPAMAQKRNKDDDKTPAKPTQTTPPADSSKKKSPFKPYAEIITAEAVTDSGLFVVHKVGPKYYYEVPDSVLGRELLMVTRYLATQESPGTYGGEELNEQVVRWERFENKLLLRVVSYNNIADSTQPIYKAVKASNFEPIVMSFDVLAISKDSTGTVVEITPLFTTDVPMLGLDNRTRQQYKVILLDGSRTFITRLKSYPTNVEVRHILTYRAAEPPSNSSTGAVSIEVSNSMVLLPAVPMLPRLEDARVGYFAQSQTDYGLDEQRAKVTTYIRRWRLEPKDPAAYARGELVEPIKPIIYYIDPATPEKWRPYLIAGVNDWQVAFEAAGFKNAIYALEAPKDDPDWSPEDARYSVIRYFASDIQNAYGPHIADPRTGEILESDIGWYHNVMNLLRNWFFVQTSPFNPEARHPKFSDEVMGQLIRFVSSHEVGHTLGLPHNMGASYSYPVDSLRSSSFTQKNGISPSIMDYARFNYVAQPEDKGIYFFPKVGEYDKWAVKWGYSYLPGVKTSEEERATLNKWVLDRASNPMYHFGRQQVALPIDPRNQTEDLGNDAMKASALGIANLKRIVPNLATWVQTPGENFDDFEEIFLNVVGQWNRYAGHVRSNVGGVYEDFKTWEQPGAVYQPVPKATQQEAVKFLNDNYFATPAWLLVPGVVDKFQRPGTLNWLGNSQAGLLNGLLEAGRLQRLSEAQALYGPTAYTLEQFFTELRGGIWKELYARTTPDVYRRNLQRAHIDRLTVLLTQDAPFAISIEAPTFSFGNTPVNLSRSDIRPAVRGELETLLRSLKGAAPVTADPTTRNHYNDLIARIDQTLNPNK